MSPRLALVLFLGLCAASVALWLRNAIVRPFRDMSVTP